MPLNGEVQFNGDGACAAYRSAKADAAIDLNRNDGSMLDALCPDTCLDHRPLAASLRRALQNRVKLLEEEQAADTREFDLLYARSDQLLLLIVERQQRLRRFREILLASWLV